MEKTIDCKHMPDDVVFEILSMLPVKTLVRFTTVCKSWSSLIRNPEFIAAHLAHQRYMKHSGCNKRWILKIKHDSCSLSENLSPDQHGRSKLLLPPGFNLREIIGHSCNGLLCINMSYEAASGIFLWNPLIRKFKIVDTLPYDYIGENEALDQVLYGFGFDELSNDHRVVRITFTKEAKMLDIYRLSTGSWHEVEGAQVPGRLRKHHTTGMYLGGAIHWLTKTTTEDFLEDLKSIVSYDFSEETFRVMELPSELQDDVDLFVDINEFKGSLALLIAEEFSGRQYCLWVMNEYGVAKSWTKKITVIPEDSWPRGFLKDGTIVHEKRRKKEKQDCKIKKFGNTLDFTESLVLID